MILDLGMLRDWYITQDNRKLGWGGYSIPTFSKAIFGKGSSNENQPSHFFTFPSKFRKSQW